MFTTILHTLPLVVVEKNVQVNEVLELKAIAQQYVLAMRIEMERRKTDADPVRQAQLAAYFTHCKMQPVHMALALRGAIKAAYKIKCYKSSAGFCRKILELAVASNQSTIANLVNAKQIKGILKLSEKENTEAHDLTYDETSSFEICPQSFTCVAKGAPQASCAYCSSVYKADFNGGLCSVCTLSKIGAETTGLKVSLN